jgi:serine/threonine-protein kinase
VTAPAPDRVGQVLLGKLQVVRRIGGGGMGEVYEVEHLLTRHRRALKIVRAELAKERRFIERFLREASIAGRLGTPFVAETFDAGWLEDESAYVLMELLSGRSLHELLADEGLLSLRRAAGLMCQVAEGAHVAHQASIVHRDLKPENVFVVRMPDGAERVKLLDFGVSKFLDISDEAATKLTREGSAIGTPYYMSPEQAAGREIDARSDVWAMGVMTYEMLTGRLPFDGETVGEVMLKIGAGEYVPLEHRRPDIDPAFSLVIDGALVRKRDKRCPSADAFRRQLLPFAGGEQAARAKTISDGARAAIVAQPLPAPPPVPEPVVEQVGPAPRLRTPRSVPPAKRVSEPPPRPRVSTPIVIGLALVALALVVSASFVGASIASGGHAPAPTSTPPPHATVSPPTSLAAPPPTTDAVAPPPPTEAPPPSTTTHRAPPRTTTTARTPAEAAGLEGNPYGR